MTNDNKSSSRSKTPTVDDLVDYVIAQTDALDATNVIVLRNHGGSKIRATDGSEWELPGANWIMIQIAPSEKVTSITFSATAASGRRPSDSPVTSEVALPAPAVTPSAPAVSDRSVAK